MQEPITRSVQLPYSVCETAFSQVGLFLDQPFPGISSWDTSDQIFSFLLDSLKSLLDHCKGTRKTYKCGFNRKNSHTEKCIKGMPLLHLHMWTSLRNDGLEWWKTTSGKRNTVAKATEFRHHRFYSDFDTDIARNSNFSGKGISKNNSTCENAVARR